MSFLSKGAEAMTGYKASDLVGPSGWSNIMHAEDRAAVGHEVDAAVFARRNFEVSYRITQRSGEVRWVSERGHAVYDERGTPRFLEGVIADISGRKEAEELQQTMLDRWRETLDSIPQMVWTLSGDGRDEFYNAQWFQFTGCQLEKPSDLTWRNLIHPDDHERVFALWNEKSANGESYETQFRLKHSSGDYRWVLGRAEAGKDRNGVPIRWYGTCTDVHEEVMTRQALHASEALNRSMIDASPDGISLLDLSGNICLLNPAALNALGLHEPSRVLGRPWLELFPGLQQTAVATATAHAAEGRVGHFVASQSHDDHPRWWDIIVAPIAGEDSRPTGLLSIARDITRQKIAEDRIRWAANHDPLTQLPNRAFFQRTLDLSLADARENGGSLTLLMMDLDDFKRTNDAFGHDGGDALLIELGSRLKRAVRADDMVARLGGDEFAILLQGAGRPEEIELAAQAIFSCLKHPWEFGGKLLDIRASIGASTFPQDAGSRLELLKHADVALFVAKSAGKDVLRIFHTSMRADAQKRQSMLNIARDAIRDDRVVAHYQPKVNLQTGQLAGFEALLRWEHPMKGLQAPSSISSAFHDGALAAEISQRMIENVLGDMCRWTDSGIGFRHVAVNAGAAEFKSLRFAEALVEKLYKANLPASCLQLEVTETVFLGRGAEHVESALKLLAEAGILIALDDFGTGFASLSHLNRFPVHIIKADRSFVGNLETSTHDATIVRTIILLGRSLGIQIVAEGIETPGQLDFLRKHRCDIGQGFLFGKAVSSRAVSSVVRDWIPFQEAGSKGQEVSAR